ncbi:MAG: LPS export ABC transporter periplasmic protein LptC [Bacteriovoracaceae bacterium]
MQLRNSRSIIIVFIYVAINGAIVLSSFNPAVQDYQVESKKAKLAPEYTIIENLDYFHLKNGVPQMSLSADKMTSQGEEYADFVVPRGVYNYQKNNTTIRYEAMDGSYRKEKEYLVLKGDVKISSPEANYYSQYMKYFFTKDLVIGKDQVKFEGEDPKTQDYIIIESDKLKANPERKLSFFEGNVHGHFDRKKKYEGKLNFSSEKMNLDGQQSLAHMENNVQISRRGYLITSGKADIFMENFNKSLKYFVLNDDVKVSETLETPTGPVIRRSFSERLEGFGREEKMVLSGAPRVEQGKEVVKGYRITIREKTDLIEVDDAMSDVQVKKKKLKD